MNKSVNAVIAKFAMHFKSSEGMSSSWINRHLVTEFGIYYLFGTLGIYTVYTITNVLANNYKLKLSC